MGWDGVNVVDLDGVGLGRVKWVRLGENNGGGGNGVR